MRTLITLAAALVSLCELAQGACPGSWSNGYTYCRSVTVDHTQVPNTDQTNFPVGIAVILATLATVGNGGHVQNASGFDIIFTSDNMGLSPMTWETVQYTATTGRVEYWVKVPTLSHTVDTVFYLFYGNPSVTTDQSSGASTWSNGFDEVYHMNLATGVSPGKLIDSTGNNTFDASVPFTFTNVSGITGEVGLIGQACLFGGISLGNITSPAMGTLPTGTSQRTVSAWINQTTCIPSAGSDCADPRPGLISWGGNVSNGDRWALLAGNTSSDQHIAVEIRNGGVNSTGTVANDANWHNVVSVFPSGGVNMNDVLFYIDGSLVGTGSVVGSPSFNTQSVNLEIGTITSVMISTGPISVLDGSLDEVEIANVARSADWIKTAYNNGNSILTFTTLGSEITNGGVVGTVSVPRPVGFL